MIAGGGVAGLEALLALRSKLHGRVEIELVSPEEEFLYKPLSVREPFGLGGPRRYPIAPIADDQDAALRIDSLQAVDDEKQVAITGDGSEIPYDFLIVATGAIQRPNLPGALVFHGHSDRRAMGLLLTQLERGDVRHVVFAVPVGVAWSLPLYELALLSAVHLAERGVEGAHLSLVTPEPEPLSVFGPRGSAAVRGLLFQRGVQLRVGAYPAGLEATTLTLAPGGWIQADRVVTLPSLRGPAIPGLPEHSDGFIPVDEHCAVEGLERVYAAGDATSFPVKQGGLAAQQADAAVDAIAARLGVPGEPEPFAPVLRGMLLTGATPTFLRARPNSRVSGTSTGVGAQSLWEPAAKIAARHLAPYLANLGHRPIAAEQLHDLDELPADPGFDVEAEHRAAVDLSLVLADADAGWQDYGFALEWLDRVEALDGVLPAEYEEKRARWSQELAKQGGK